MLLGILGMIFTSVKCWLDLSVTTQILCWTGYRSVFKTKEILISHLNSNLQVCRLDLKFCATAVSLSLFTK